MCRFESLRVRVRRLAGRGRGKRLFGRGAR